MIGNGEENPKRSRDRERLLAGGGTEEAACLYEHGCNYSSLFDLAGHFFLYQLITTLHIKSGILNVPRSILHVLPMSYLFRPVSLLHQCTVLCLIVLEASKGTKLLPFSDFSYRFFSLFLYPSAQPQPCSPWLSSLCLNPR